MFQMQTDQRRKEEIDADEDLRREEAKNSMQMIEYSCQKTLKKKGRTTHMKKGFFVSRLRKVLKVDEIIQKTRIWLGALAYERLCL